MRRACAAAAAWFVLLLPIAAEAAAPPREDDAARRGFAVYQQVCSVCHALSHAEIGDLAGLGLSGRELRALAAQMQVPGPPDASGAPTMRPATLSDRLLSRFPDEASARAANNGALPPDLSEMARTRRGGAAGIAALLTGYADPPPGFEVPAGHFYNRAAADHLIAMPPPLADGAVSYADATPATLTQEAHDAAAFLAWSADPHRAARQWIGCGTIAFLAILAALVHAYRRRIWQGVSSRG